MVAMVRVATGNTRYRAPSHKPPPLKAGTPPAGRMPRITANRMMSSRASQNGGTEMPAKANRLIA